MKELQKVIKETHMIWWYLIIIIGEAFQAWAGTKKLEWMSLAVDNYRNPMKWIYLVIGTYILRVIVGLLCNVGYRKRNKISIYIRRDLANHVLKSDYGYFTKVGPSEIEATVDDSNTLSKIPDLIIRIINNVVEFLVALIAIVRVSPEGMLSSVVTITVALIALMYGFKRWGDCDDRLNKLNRSRMKELYKTIAGFQEVRSFKGAIKYHDTQLKKSDNEVLSIIYKRNVADNLIDNIITITEGIIKVSLLIFGINELRKGTISASMVLVLIMYAGNLFNPVINIIDRIDALSPMIVSAKRVDKMLGIKPSMKDGNGILEDFSSDISFHNVSFSYEGEDGGLKDINLTIHKGEKIGICGRSGCGKSTMLSLIPRFYDVNSGSIKLDGIDIRNLKRDSILKHLGIVQQSPYIFDGTIEENIAYGRPGENVSHEEIVEATKKAAIYDFIISIPEGFNTVVGERGLKLSGGQQQRIALARIFLSDPEILLLDEATSALDNESESIIQETLESFKDRTIIAVAHRLSTIRNHDRIIVMDDCKIVDIGTHNELLDRCPEYQKLQK